jgi:hypothetical protein
MVRFITKLNLALLLGHTIVFILKRHSLPVSSMLNHLVVTVEYNTV